VRLGGRARRWTLAAAIGVSACLSLPAAALAQGDAWVQRALGLQYELGGDLGFRDAPWVGTHNSFNSVAELGPTLSAQDGNQRISLREQLDQGMRSVELDLHWFSRPNAPGFDVVVCHARGREEGHAGCTTEKTLADILDETIVPWLRENPGQVLMLYLEDDMDETAGYERAGAILEEKLGGLLFRPKPSADGCEELPLELTRDEIRAADAKAFVVTDCGDAASWRGTVFTWEEHEESQPTGFTDFPGCGTEFTREQYDSTLVRYYEDSTRLSAGAGIAKDPITGETAAQMVRCGVDLIHFDQLEVGDPRLASVIWSWAPGEPKKGSCSTQRVGGSVPFGRWKSRDCKGKRRAACYLPNGRWRLTSARVRFPDIGEELSSPPPDRRAFDACEKRDGEFAVPRTGYEAQLLRLAMERAGVRGVWLGQLRDGDRNWFPLDSRDSG
jgi:hypothetical protein